MMMMITMMTMSLVTAIKKRMIRTTASQKKSKKMEEGIAFTLGAVLYATKEMGWMLLTPMIFAMPVRNPFTQSPVVPASGQGQVIPCPPANCVAINYQMTITMTIIIALTLLLAKSNLLRSR
jgi:hypothetical protein